MVRLGRGVCARADCACWEEVTWQPGSVAAARESFSPTPAPGLGKKTVT